MTTLDAIGLVIELLSWIGLCTGIPLLMLGILRRSTAATWHPTSAVIVDERLTATAGSAAPVTVTDDDDRAASTAASPPVLLRWFGDDGEVHSAVVGPDHHISPHSDDDVIIYVSSHRPDQIHLHQPAAPGKAFMLSGWILAGIGAAAVVASIVLSAL